MKKRNVKKSSNNFSADILQKAEKSAYERIATIANYPLQNPMKFDLVRSEWHLENGFELRILSSKCEPESA
jgi:hypothetical protein